MISAIRSLLHLLFMAVTVIPWSLAVVLARLSSNALVARRPASHHG